MARRTLLITASILLAALGTALIWLYVQGAENRAQQLFPALFLTRNVRAGESPVGAVTQLRLPADAAAGAVASANEVGNQTLKVDAVAGEVLLKSMLGTSAGPAGRFPRNGAVAVTINDPNRVPADLQPGDTVDIVELGKGTATIVDSLRNLTVRTVGGAHAQTPTGLAGANANPQTSAISPTIVGLDIKDAETAKKLYEIVARGDQIALYLHNPSTP